MFPIINIACFCLQFFLLILIPARTVIADEAYHEPFYLGVVVEADPVASGDLPNDGRFSIEGICRDLASLKVNAVWVNGFDGERATMKQMGRWLESSRGHVIKVVLQGSAGDYAIKKDVSIIERQTHLRLYLAPIWKEVARRYGRHFALLAYVPVEAIGEDAEEGAKPALEALDELGSTLNEIDPLNPVITNHDAVRANVALEEARVRQRRMRVLAAYHYPFAHPHPYSSGTAETADAAAQHLLDLTLKHVHVAGAVGAPFWLTGQAFGSVLTKKWVGQWKDAALPSKNQMELQVWTAILAGAKGFFASRYQSSQEPSDPEKARREDWVVVTAMRTLQGEPTAAYEGLKAIAAILSRHLSVLGELKTDGEIIVLKPKVLARRFKARNGKAFAVVLNQDLAASVKLLEKTALGSFTSQEGLRLAPGQGVLFQANDSGAWVPVTPCEIL